MEKEKINWQGYAPEKNSEYFKKHAFRYSVMCICGIILLAAAANLFFNVYREIFGADLKLLIQQGQFLLLFPMIQMDLQMKITFR